MTFDILDRNGDPLYYIDVVRALMTQIGTDRPSALREIIEPVYNPGGPAHAKITFAISEIWGHSNVLPDSDLRLVDLKNGIKFHTREDPVFSFGELCLRYNQHARKTA